MIGYSVIRQVLAKMPPAILPAMRKLGRPILQSVVGSVVNRWPPYSHLFLIGDSASWALDWEMRQLADVLQLTGVNLAAPFYANFVSRIERQSVFYASQFVLSSGDCLRQTHRVGVAYYHGLPGTGFPEFDNLYSQLCRYHQSIHRLQVTHSEMHNAVLNSGIAPEKVFTIPIGITPDYFSVQTDDARRLARRHYGIPQSAVVIGSFQKDGEGWGEGLEPKLIKGPDVFLRTIELLKPRVPELFVLLSGPARGYVKAGLQRLGVPYHHTLLKHYPDVGQLFQSLNVYVVASRQEGGPKAVLESMASGVPLVTTRVGQAMDLVRHGENGWMVEIQDAEGLAHWAEYAVSHPASISDVLFAGRETAEANSYEAQVPLWAHFMRGFVEW